PGVASESASDNLSPRRVMRRVGGADMKRFALALSCALAGIMPAITKASLRLQIGPERGADAVDAVVAPGSGERFFDLVFNESGPPVNEHLIAYDVGVDAARPGLSLVRAEKPDNWV